MIQFAFSPTSQHGHRMATSSCPPRRFHPIAMTWHDLAFIHWPFPPELVRPLIPSGLELDTFDGQAWIGVVPFGMSGVGYPVIRHLGIFSKFLEINVRTYVKRDGYSGIWFFSLDAACRFAVQYCRTLYRLPYYFAEIEKREDPADNYYYRNLRLHRGSTDARFVGSYRPIGEVYQSKPGDLDYWLTERYCLFSEGTKSRLYRCDIRHPHWPLQNASVDIQENTMLSPLQLTPPSQAPLVHFAKKLVVKSTHLQCIDRSKTDRLR